ASSSSPTPSSFPAIRARVLACTSNVMPSSHHYEIVVGTAADAGTTGGGAADGRVTVTSRPPSGLATAVTVPPCASATARTIDRPRPEARPPARSAPPPRNVAAH